MTLYDITPECLEREYHGCGKAWAVISNGKVIALRYMGEDRYGLWPTEPAVPEWVKAVQRAAQGCDNHMLPCSWSSRNLAELARAAEACEDCPRPPHRKRYRPTELLSMARAALTAINTAQFGVYRERCRAELSAIGEVVSGMCSCTQFYVD